MRSLLSLASAVALLASAATAQITKVAGSGCPTIATQCKTGGTPGLGQQVGFKCSCSGLTDGAFLIFGFEINPALPLNPPLMCGTGACNLVVFEVASLVAVGGVSITLTIPRDPTLLGACIAVQGGCLDANRRCLDLATGYQMCIQP